MVDKVLLKNNFSRFASYYDKHAVIQRRCAAVLIRQLQHVHASGILDVGCGTGIYTGFLRRLFPHASITAVDISGDMVGVARGKPWAGDIEFIVADAETLDLKRKFDVITSNASFQWFHDLQRSLGRYRKALARDGCMLFSTFGPQTFFELRQALKDSCGPGTDISVSDFKPGPEIVRILKRLFSSFDIREITYTHEYTSLIDLLNTIRYTGARGKASMKQGFWTPQRLNAIEAAYRRNHAAIVATYQVFFCRAVL